MKFISILLFPFALLYDLATRFRNHLYNIGYKRSFEFEVNTIAVGNLSVGGTGKSPMIEYLIRLLKDDFKVATLSRGYGRTTKGFRLAGEEDNAITLGDEPFQFYRKFKEQIRVAVGAERALAIPFMLAENDDIEVILLDDAYQHRSVKAGVNILLTDYSRLFYKDCILPSGRLRESGNGAKRADVIIVTKCPHNLGESDMKSIKIQLEKYNANAPIFFTGIQYGNLKPCFKTGNPIEMPNKLYLFTGVANPRPLHNHLKDQFILTDEKIFADHHQYSESDIRKLADEIKKDHSGMTGLVTTEKDMVKFLKRDFRNILENLPVYYVPIETCFLQDGKLFDDLILKSIRQYSN
ncbi:tetraacyldisaccharide 4'-kinase [Fulvivirga sp. M361]|uniref:tetraacyldisaccharide 4'-kinase n=1 Tax=Fulvivirga sp. M361 TaxID=2594266 RepID=UPI00117A941E|nr:tetraacyldisaccharide 4'-kinase [Fulvivirga sp. M361]TRX49491.1 tetraacyldisaccharide 4'-kinase [Fulvivirga sp. M361]